MTKAAPRDRQSTSTAKIAALLVSVSFVNIPLTPSLAEEPARRSCLAAGSWLGGGPRSRRRAGSCPAPSRGLSWPRNGRIILPSEGSVCALWHQNATEHH